MAEGRRLAAEEGAATEGAAAEGVATEGAATEGATTKRENRPAVLGHGGGLNKILTSVLFNEECHTNTF